jgi:outer membrane usher protein FimD/PapC
MRRLRVTAQAIYCGLAVGTAACCSLAWAQAADRGAQAAAEDLEIIVNVRANGVERGEFSLVQLADGDYLVGADQVARLRLKPQPQAQRTFDGKPHVSFRALGATGMKLDPADLSLQVDFPVAAYDTTRVDLANRPAPLTLAPTRNSAILNYRAAVARTSDDAPVQLRLTTELNVRIGDLLLRQEARYRNGNQVQRFARGATQLLWDDRAAGTRMVVGDQFVSGNTFGTAFTGAGVSYSRLFGMTPDVIRQPTAAFQVAASGPSEVVVTVDGSPVYRTTAGPGPIALDNLFYFGGARTVQIVVTDPSGRRQVIEQPYLFSDSVLARGVQEFNYFLGKRTFLDASEVWRYREGTWQAFHRYGVTDHLTVQAGGEGNAGFASGGVGATWRHDLLGLLSLDLLASHDRLASQTVPGWSGRYTYTAPNISFSAGHRQLGDGFQTIATTLGSAALLEETRVSAATRILKNVTMSADALRARDTRGERTSHAVRVSSFINRQVSVNAEYMANRLGADRDWSVNVYMRMDLGPQDWVGANYRTERNLRSVDIEAGRQLVQGEGLGYRVGMTSTTGGGQNSAFAYGAANWNLPHATLEVYGSSQVRGGRSTYLDAAVSGALVALDGTWGATRFVGDSFAVARLGVPHKGVEIFLNNQSQGHTNAAGELLIPQVGAFGRQDITLDDRQLPMEYNIGAKRMTIAPAYRSGTVVEFGGRRLRAYTGTAVLLRGGKSTPIAARAWTLSGAGGSVKVETERVGEFYVEDVPPGKYTGSLEVDGKSYACRLTLPDSPEAVMELKEGVICE